MFPDSSLSSENLSTVLDSMENDLWREFSRYVNIPASERRKIQDQYSSDRQRKQAVIPHLISTHPSLSWRLVANALYQMMEGTVYGDVSSHRALDHLQQKFPTGTVNNTTPPRVISPAGRGRTYCKHYRYRRYVPVPVSDFPRGDGGMRNFYIALGPESTREGCVKF